MITLTSEDLIAIGEYKFHNDEQILIKHIAALRACSRALVAALQGAQEAFDILANATAEDGWIYVAPQFVSANLAAVTAALAGERDA